ncbi:aminopeptidase PepB [Idiomarina xiamenensis]|nr:aminopeptidase PepB [Idiomarina xiamenensis]
MSRAMPVYLSNERSATAAWKASAAFYWQQDAITIPLADNEADNLRAIQRAGRQLDNSGLQHLAIAGEGWDIERQWALAQGFTSTLSSNQISWHEQQPQVAEQLTQMTDIARWTRELVNLPPAEIYPQSLAQRVIDKFKDVAGDDQIDYKIIAGDDLLEAGWVGIHHVGRASVKQPLMLQLDFIPDGNKDTDVSAALIGKGITFDSGGYSIKASEGMLAMKCDMGGAATVAGALLLAIQRGLKKRVRLILCCAENLIDGSAYKLGDVITYKNGTSVEVVNTDAEGRLVLADGLLAAGEAGAKLVIDAATLTGAAQMAVGNEYNALFSVDDGLAAETLNLAAQEREPLWRLPLAHWHSNNCPSAFADTANSRPQKGGGAGGASNAAGFLLRFAPHQGQGWLHFDLAGAYHNSANGMWATGATALGIRTIAATLMHEA